MVLENFIVLNVDPTYRLNGKWTVCQVKFRTPGGEERDYNFFKNNKLHDQMCALKEGQVCNLSAEKNAKGYTDIVGCTVVGEVDAIPTEDPAKTFHLSRGTTPATRPVNRGRPQSPDGIDYGYEDSPAKQRRIMKAVALDKALTLLAMKVPTKFDPLEIAGQAVMLAEMFEPYLSSETTNTGATEEAVAEMLEG